MRVRRNGILILHKISKFCTIPVGVTQERETFLTYLFPFTTHEKFFYSFLRLFEHRKEINIARAPLHCNRD